ncbi:MAG: MFS transporter [Fluviicoccus sp.]|uniref:MFS transporter n=1 Tax=Fluviicoccus sp. TaxID=2003552 RepID=UPI0027173E59|nr:MFS transporter [Fluviicoccus sp.]MDO8328845.1 MFS transporter [Fluviicoccus sp.]
MSLSILPKTATHLGAESRSNRPLASLSLIVLLSSLASSIANVGLPTLARVFDAPFADVQWVVIAYLLSVTTLVVSAGRLGDLLGRRRVLLTGIGVFTVASALCSLAPSLGWLIATRALQGMGAAVMMALTLALVGETVPKQRTGSAMGFLGAMSAVGTALGPTLGGLMIATFDWRFLFVINLPLGLIAAWLASRYLPADETAARTGRAGLDLPGMMLLAMTLAAYALAMTTGRGNAGLINLPLLMAAAVGLALFLWVETRTDSALIRLSLFRNAVFSSGFIMSALVTTVMMATLVVGPFYLSCSLDLSTSMMGMVMSAGPASAALAGVPSGRLVDRFGAPLMTLAGLMVMLSGVVMLSMAPSGWGVSGYVLPLMSLTAGFALFQAANNTAVLAEARPEQRGVISGLLNLSRNLGFVTGASVMGAVFVRASERALPDVPLAMTSGLSATFSVAAGLVLVALGVAAFQLTGCRVKKHL